MQRKLKQQARLRLTDAYKRSNLLSSVMIKITYNGKVIECSNAAETIELLKYIDAEEKKRIEHRVPGAMESIHQELATLGGKVEVSPWTRELFWKFIESLGDAQHKALGLLVQKHKVADEDLRKALKLDGNQALAGVLSGVSKQAGILNISARSVYTVENERRAGTLSKTYVAANEFMRIANEMNWPEE